MRLSKFSTVLLLAAALFAGAAMAADAPKLESINAASGVHQDCPVEHGKAHDKCEHKDGKPCPHHKDKTHDKCEHKDGKPCPHHKDKAHDKCEHKH